MPDELKRASSLPLAVGLIASLGTSASAGALVWPGPVEPAPVAVVPVPVPLPPDSDGGQVVPPWHGLYAGGHLGGAVVDWESETSFVATSPLTGETRSGSFDGPDSSASGLIGGVQGGYNWRSGNYVYGVEASASVLGGESEEDYTISAASLIDAGLAAITDPVDGFESDWTRSVEWLTTARGRVGYLANPRTFLYVTGGLALGEVRSDVSYTGLVDDGTSTLVSVSSDSRETQLGYVVGGGAEAALTERLSIRAEYLYVDLGDSDRRLGTYIDSPCCDQTVSVNEDVSVHMVTIGLTYHFAWQ